MALQRVRSLATTKFTDETVANAYTPAAGEMISIFVNGTYRGLRIGDGATVGGLSLVNSGSELYEYIGEAPPDDTDLPVVDPVEDSDSGEISTPAPVVDETTGLVEQTLVDARLSGMNSLLFDGNSHLYREFGSGGSRETMTYSFWCKQDELNRSMQFLSAGSSVSDQIYMASENSFKGYLADGLRIDSNPQVFRDMLVWNHFVFTIDTPNNNIRLYQNGKQIVTGSLSGNTKLNDSITHYIGKYALNDGEYFIGRLANIQFIDGMALDASYFGEYMGANWVPKVYEGAYGANGFWLDFSDTEFDSGTGELVTVKDVAPLEGAHTTANDWQAA